jgi:tripartite ATP-independent transporter DctM subunit
MSEFFIATALLFLTILVGVPIAFSIGITTAFYIFITNPRNFTVMPLRMFAGVDSFILLAIPLFVLAAEIMVRADISKRLFNFVKVFVGRFRGGLAYVNVLASTVFGSISGAALSDIAGLGYIEINAMKENGYKDDFSCAVTAASSIQSPLIPPSNIIVIYGGIMSLSIGALFMAGVVPGLLIAFGQIAYIFLNAKRLDLPKDTHVYTGAELKTILLDGMVAIVMPAIILVGIIGGIFTPTEAAAVAVVYALFVGLFITKKVRLKDLPACVWEAAKTSANLIMIISFSTVFSWALGIQNIPNKIAQFMLSISTNPTVLLLMVNFILIIVGMWMEVGAAIILFAPILAPIMYKVGVHPIHFAMVMVTNLTVGLITPPVGVVLYATSAVGKIKFERLVKAMMPFIILAFVDVLLITLFPDLGLFIPRAMGLVAK